MQQTVDAAVMMTDSEETEIVDVVLATTVVCGSSCFLSAVADLATAEATTDSDAAAKVVCGSSCYSSSAADSATDAAVDARL